MRGHRRGEFTGQLSGEERNDQMNSWKEEQNSPADTYIEWRFEHKCKQLSGGFRIITEWRKRKLQYISILKTISMDFQHYSRHDETHSVYILTQIEQLLGKQRVDLLSAGDLWLILEVAYSHDTGMAMTYNEMLELWEKEEEFQDYIRKCIEEDLGDVTMAALYYQEMDNLLHDRKKMEGVNGKKEVEFSPSWPVVIQYYVKILVAEYIRSHHAKRAEKLFFKMDKEMEQIIPVRLYQTVILVSQMHGKNFQDILDQLKYCVNGFGSGVLHPQFVAAMLRIGDLLDIDNNRFDPYAVQRFGRLPLASMLHAKKHTSITHIYVSESEVTAEADTAEYEVALLTSEWFQMIQKEVENLICAWNEIVPEALQGCVLKKSNCKVFFHHRYFDIDMRKEFTVNKKKIINLLIGTNIYSNSLDFIREYLQNAMDASKMQLWMDLKHKKYDFQRNRSILDYGQISPFDLENSVYNNYPVIIRIEWNDSKDRILIKITDCGIGIEEEYFQNLSNIGTGWRGREQYAEELRQMPKWLRPTGGFGIGIQSAFMVTDCVELLTKSDKDAHGHRVRLLSPNKGGSIAVEDWTGVYLHGTTVAFEIEPEQFQGWMERQRESDRENIKNIWQKSNYSYDLENWDEFEPEGMLMYVRQFFMNYIRMMIPNPLFPIEVDNSIAVSQVYRNPYWVHTNYWETVNDGLSMEWSYEGKQYLGIYAKDEIKNYFLVWDQTDGVLTRISKQGTDKTVCFKNVLVKEKEESLLDLFCKYSVCIDLMGLYVDNCLKIHRNSFFESFRWEQYCYDSFRVYVRFLWEQYVNSTNKIKESAEEKIRNIEKYLEEQLTVTTDETKKQNLKAETGSEIARIQQTCQRAMRQDEFIAEWESLPVQMLRLIAFEDICDAPCEIMDNENAIIDVQEIFVNIDDHGQEKIEVLQEQIRGNKILDLLQRYYKQMKDQYDIKNNIEFPIVILGSGEKYMETNNIGISISLHTIRRWLEERKNINDEVINSILETLINGIGVINDEDIIKMLMSDRRLYTKRLTAGGKKFFLLQCEKELQAVDQQSFFKSFWQESIGGRRYVTGKDTDRYPVLKISELPFRTKEGRKAKVYLLSPVSNNNYRNVEKLKGQGLRLSFEDFRMKIWGPRKKESSEYFMLIDWVVKHQVTERKYTKEKIAEAYEDFLLDLYKACVYVP